MTAHISSARSCQSLRTVFSVIPTFKSGKQSQKPSTPVTFFARKHTFQDDANDPLLLRSGAIIVEFTEDLLMLVPVAREGKDHGRDAKLHVNLPWIIGSIDRIQTIIDVLEGEFALSDRRPGAQSHFKNGSKITAVFLFCKRSASFVSQKSCYKRLLSTQYPPLCSSRGHDNSSALGPPWCPLTSRGGSHRACSAWLL